MNKRVLVIFILLGVVLLAGCNSIIYNPASDNGDTMNIKVIKGVVEWLKYYIEGEDLNGLMSIVYPYSPYYSDIKNDYTTLFIQCSNIKWNYEISDVLLKSDGTAFVTGEYVMTASCGEGRGELYIVMKQSGEGIWYIYSINSLVFD
jgi:hypothetical protein